MRDDEQLIFTLGCDGRRLEVEQLADHISITLGSTYGFPETIILDPHAAVRLGEVLIDLAGRASKAEVKRFSIDAGRLTPQDTTDYPTAPQAVTHNGSDINGQTDPKEELQ